MTVFWVVIIWPFKILRTVVIYQNRVLEEIFQESPRLWTLKNSPGTGQFLLPAQHSHFRPFDLLPIKESAMTHNQNYSPEATLHDYGNLRFTLGPLLELCKNYTHNYNSSHWHVSGRAEIWSILYIYIYIYTLIAVGDHTSILCQIFFSLKISLECLNWLKSKWPPGEEGGHIIFPLSEWLCKHALQIRVLI
jgi:hypothetical protein